MLDSKSGNVGLFLKNLILSAENKKKIFEKQKKGK